MDARISLEGLLLLSSMVLPATLMESTGKHTPLHRWSSRRLARLLCAVAPPGVLFQRLQRSPQPVVTAVSLSFPFGGFTYDCYRAPDGGWRALVTPQFRPLCLFRYLEVRHPDDSLCRLFCCVFPRDLYLILSVWFVAPTNVGYLECRAYIISEAVGKSYLHTFGDKAYLATVTALRDQWAEEADAKAPHPYTIRCLILCAAQFHNDISSGEKIDRPR